MTGISMQDVAEPKKPEAEGFKEIKPEGGTSFSDAAQFWDKQFQGESLGHPKEHLDDNGQVYRIGDQLLPNKSFEVNSYQYETDDKGRTVCAEGKLHLRDPDFKRKMDTMEAVSKGDALPSDDKGHLIGYQFEGSGGIENLIPMDAKLNHGDYLKMESTLAAAVKDGADVRLKVEPIYTDDTRRPTEIRATYTIDGEKETVVFKNGGGTDNA